MIMRMFDAVLVLLESLYHPVATACAAEVMLAGRAWRTHDEYYKFDDPSAHRLSRWWAVLTGDRKTVSYYRRREKYLHRCRSAMNKQRADAAHAAYAYFAPKHC